MKRKVLSGLILFTFCLIFVSCGGDDPSAGDYESKQDDMYREDPGDGGQMPFELMYSSGDRLNMRIAKSPGGAKQFLGMHDTELEVDCNVHDKYSPGTFRCYPATTSILYYYDSSCSDPAIINPKCLSFRYRYAVSKYDHDECSYGYFYKAGAKDNRPIMYYKGEYDDSCNEKDLSWHLDTEDFYHAEEQVDISIFQKMDVELVN